MIKVGVTGGIGSGKSAVCKLFAEFGVPVYCSDARAREIMNAPGETRQAIVRLLGPESYRHDTIDSAYVADKVFVDKTLLASLDAIVHPAVALDFEAWALSLTDKPYVVLESAILFESGLDRLVDHVVSVFASTEVRMERVLARGGNRGVVPSREDVMRRMANQMTDAERETRADFRIDNNGTLAELRAKVQLLDKELKQ